MTTFPTRIAAADAGRAPRALAQPGRPALWLSRLIVFAGLLLSAGIGLFGFQESLAVPYAGSSLVVEFAGAAVLAAASAIVLAARPGSRPAQR